MDFRKDIERIGTKRVAQGLAVCLFSVVLLLAFAAPAASQSDVTVRFQVVGTDGNAIASGTDSIQVVGYTSFFAAKQAQDVALPFGATIDVRGKHVDELGNATTYQIYIPIKPKWKDTQFVVYADGKAREYKPAMPEGIYQIIQVEFDILTTRVQTVGLSGTPVGGSIYVGGPDADPPSALDYSPSPVDIEVVSGQNNLPVWGKYTDVLGNETVYTALMQALEDTTYTIVADNVAYKTPTDLNEDPPHSRINVQFGVALVRIETVDGGGQALTYLDSISVDGGSWGASPVELVMSAGQIVAVSGKNVDVFGNVTEYGAQVRVAIDSTFTITGPNTASVAPTTAQGDPQTRIQVQFRVVDGLRVQVVDPSGNPLAVGDSVFVAHRSARGTTPVYVEAPRDFLRSDGIVDGQEIFVQGKHEDGGISDAYSANVFVRQDSTITITGNDEVSATLTPAGEDPSSLINVQFDSRLVRIQTVDFGGDPLSYRDSVRVEDGEWVESPLDVYLSAGQNLTVHGKNADVLGHVTQHSAYVSVAKDSTVTIGKDGEITILPTGSTQAPTTTLINVKFDVMDAFNVQVVDASGNPTAVGDSVFVAHKTARGAPPVYVESPRVFQRSDGVLNDQQVFVQGKHEDGGLSIEYLANVFVRRDSTVTITGNDEVSVTLTPAGEDPGSLINVQFDSRLVRIQTVDFGGDPVSYRDSVRVEDGDWMESPLDVYLSAGQNLTVHGKNVDVLGHVTQHSAYVSVAKDSTVTIGKDGEITILPTGSTQAPTTTLINVKFDVMDAFNVQVVDASGDPTSVGDSVFVAHKTARGAPPVYVESPRVFQRSDGVLNGQQVFVQAKHEDGGLTTEYLANVYVGRDSTVTITGNDTATTTLTPAGEDPSTLVNVVFDTRLVRIQTVDGAGDPLSYMDSVRIGAGGWVESPLDLYLSHGQKLTVYGKNVDVIGNVTEYSAYVSVAKDSTVTIGEDGHVTTIPTQSPQGPISTFINVAFDVLDEFRVQVINHKGEALDGADSVYVAHKSVRNLLPTYVKSPWNFERTDAVINGTLVFVQGKHEGDGERFEYFANVHVWKDSTVTIYGTDLATTEPSPFGQVPQSIIGVQFDLNEPPVAVDDVASTPEDTLAVIPVLANDSDPDEDPLTIVDITDPANGIALDNGDGTISYTPDADFHGTDTFDYTIDDGEGDTAEATVTVTVTSVNDAPSFTKGADQEVLEDAEAATVAGWATGMVAGPENESGQALNFVVTNDRNGLFSAQPSISADGILTYAPAADSNGVAEVRVVLKDDAGTANGGVDSSSVETFTITVTPVNDAPSFTKGSDQEVLEDADAVTVAGWATGISKGPENESGQALSFVVTNDRNGLFSAQPSISADGILAYTLAADSNGVAEVRLVLKDDGGTANGGVDSSSVETFTITVTPVNDAPVAVADAYEVDEDNGLTVDAAEGVLDNDIDADDDELEAELVEAAEHGVLTFNPDGSFEYAPFENYYGPDSFTYKAKDAESESEAVEVTITVNPVNDAPVAAADDYEGNEDETLLVEAPGVLGNDEDIGSEDLTATLVVDVQSGELDLSSDGSFTYTPDEDFEGTVSFTYVATDGDLTSEEVEVTIEILSANDAPEAMADAYEADEDVELVVEAADGVLANDTDVDEDVLTALLVTDVQHGSLELNEDGSFTYLAEENYYGSDSFTYKASDGELESPETEATIEVAPVNDVPVADASPDQNGVECEGPTTVITLDGTGSYDVDDDDLSYVWTEGETRIDTGIWTGSPQPQVELALGLHIIKLTVSDGNPVGDGIGEHVWEDEVVVEVVDTTPPVIQVLGDNPITLEIGTPYPDPDPGATAEDVCDGEVDVLTDLSGVDVAREGTYFVVYTASDLSGNTATEMRTVNVVVTGNSYVVFATNSAWIGNRAKARSGFIGVNDHGSRPFLNSHVELVIGTKAQTADGVRISGPDVYVMPLAYVAGELQYESLREGNRSFIGRKTLISPWIPLLDELPEFLTGDPGTQDVTVRSKRSETLDEGAYGKVRVHTKGTLTFTGGTYSLSSFWAGAQSKIRFEGPTVLLIEGRFATGTKSTFRPANGSGIDASDIKVYVNGSNRGSALTKVAIEADDAGEAPLMKLSSLSLLKRIKDKLKKEVEQTEQRDRDDDDDDDDDDGDDDDDEGGGDEAGRDGRFEGQAVRQHLRAFGHPVDPG